MNLIIDLPDDKATALRENAERLGVSAEAYARQLIERDLKKHGFDRLGIGARPKLRHISEVMSDIMGGVPPGQPT